MAEAVVSFVIERLGDLLLNEARFVSGVTDEVEEAKTELQRIQCFLEDADARARQGDKTLQNHVAEIRDAAYDLEDVTATFALKVASRSEQGRMYVFIRFPCILIHLHKVRSEVEKIISRISKSRLSFQDYGVLLQSRDKEGASSSNERLLVDLRRTFSHNIDVDFVGFGEDIKKLVGHLTREGSLHKVVSICGMGGLGKTTLARKIYHHNDIRKHFNGFAWATVSQKCQARDVWEGILIKLTSPTTERRKEIKEMKDDEIAKALYNVLKEKKCLVVLDDIWTAATWNCLKSAFPSESESKVLFTTRNRDLGLRADPHSILHEPKCFNEDESWELFRNKTYFGRNMTVAEDDEKKQKLAREMLYHCGGLPLAITVLGGLLSSKQTIAEWETLHKSIKTILRKGKINEQEDSNLGVSWVLGLSYDELPYYLKPCFMHLAYFPEDFEIRAAELCKIWMAEGFVSNEDAAYESLSKLVERCIIQVAEWGSTGRIKTCRIHDLMRDLCLSKSQEENFLQAVDIRNRDEAISSTSFGMTTNFTPSYKVRRLAIYLNNNRAKECLSLIRNKDGCLRSLICFNSKLDTSYDKVMKPLLNRFHLLRVLKFENLWIEKLPDEIGDLIHLRLFSLRGSFVIRFPSSIGKLRSLQTLDLRLGANRYLRHSGYIRQRQLSQIQKLEQLRHLYLTWRYESSNLRLDNLVNLQTLVDVRANYNFLDSLEKLTNLTKLQVILGPDFGDTRVRFNNLRSLAISYSGDSGNSAKFIENVKSFIISCPQIYKLYLNVGLVKLPEDNEFSPNLTKLTLRGTGLRDDPMATLEKLPNLRILLLGIDCYKGAKMVCKRKGFPKLESLYFDLLRGLEEWVVEEGALPCLRRLHIAGCLELRTIPDGVRYLITLKEIVIERMHKNFMERTEQGGEDFYKVEHVPSLVILSVL